MILLLRTDSHDPRFRQLVHQLDEYLAIQDGDEHSFYHQYNQLDDIKHVVLATESGVAVGCGAIKKFSEDAMEVKRMFVLPSHRGKRVASGVLEELEKWAAELGCTKCVLETGKRQPEAVGLYHARGYQQTENYGQYIGMDNSICFEKLLNTQVR